MEINDTFDTDMDLLASGFVAHTWEGSFILAGFGGMWTNSYEAEHHLSFHPSAKDPVC